MGRQTDGHIGGQTDAKAYGLTAWQIERQVDRQMDSRHTDRRSRTDKQTDRWKERKIYTDRRKNICRDERSHRWMQDSVINL
jgi:hypothetical protein